MGKEIRLGVICPIVNDPTSFYRGLGPLSMLQKQMDLVFLTFPTGDPDWSVFKQLDALFLQRPCNVQHFNALVRAKECGIPVWTDFDDDNLSVGEDNPMELEYSQPHIKDSIVKLARYSDCLTVSTEFLKQKYGIYNKNIFVVPNALDDALLILRQIPSTPREKKFLWRGSATHHANLEVVKEALIRAAAKNPSWKFSFCGHKPVDIKKRIKNHDIVFPMMIPVMEYFKSLIQQHPTALWYSLASNDHSQARSHVSWLEATYCGAQFIGPKHPEFERPGVLNFATPEEFEAHIDAIASGSIDIDKNVKLSWDEIQEKYLLTKVNQMRAGILKELTHK